MELVIRSKMVVDYEGSDLPLRTVSAERTDENEVKLELEVPGDSEQELSVYLSAVDAAALGTQLVGAAGDALP